MPSCGHTIKNIPEHILKIEGVNFICRDCFEKKNKNTFKTIDNKIIEFWSKVDNKNRSELKKNIRENEKIYNLSLRVNKIDV